MTVASEISRLQCAKADIKTAIEGKGVEVGSSVKLDEYAVCIGEIQQGGGEGILPISTPVLSGTAKYGKTRLYVNDPDNDSCRGTQLTCWTDTTIVRKLGSDPTSIDDGDVVVVNTTRDQYCSNCYIDNGLTNNCTYHYKAFANVCIGEGSSSSVLCLTPIKSFDVDFLLIAGGGGGGGGYNSYAGGGGGAGGVIYCTGYTIGNIDTANITIGNGGGGGYGSSNGTSGGNSVFCSTLFNFSSCGGGGGGRYYSSGLYGGSGGGAGGGCSSASGGGAVSGQGKAGGSHTNANENSSGGGGACGAGGNSAGYAGSGGNGVTYNISGTNVGYAGGGGGAGASGYGCFYGCPGACGGGAGGNCGSSGSNATSCGSGGGGGGGSYYDCKSGGRGGNGIFIMRYPTSCGYDITGGCKYTCSNYTIHCFTSSGTLTFN